MIEDKRAFNIFLMILIGIPAIILVCVASTRHSSLSEFIVAIFVGMAGIIWVLYRALSLKSLSTENADIKTEGEGSKNHDTLKID
jgi:hypothetical protein